MTTFLIVLLLFLLAFTGLATGLLLRGTGITGGCGSGHSGGGCHCKSKPVVTVVVVRGKD
jgi:hypothetical protein